MNPRCPRRRRPMQRNGQGLKCGRHDCGTDPAFIEFMRGYGIEFPSPKLIALALSALDSIEANPTRLKESIP